MGFKYNFWGWMCVCGRALCVVLHRAAASHSQPSRSTGAAGRTPAGKQSRSGSPARRLALQSHAAPRNPLPEEPCGSISSTRRALCQPHRPGDFGSLLLLL